MNLLLRLKNVREQIEKYPFRLEELSAKHPLVEKAITLDRYTKLLTVGAQLEPIAKAITLMEAYDLETVTGALSSHEVSEAEQTLSQVEEAIREVTFGNLAQRDERQIEGLIRAAVKHLKEVGPRAEHLAFTLKQRAELQGLLRPRQPDPIDTTQADQAIEKLRKETAHAEDAHKLAIEKLQQETDKAEKAHAKLRQMELADDQIEAIDKCIQRHKGMSEKCLWLLAAVCLIAARLIVWISADNDKLFGCCGPMFHALLPETSGGVAFYYGVGKLAVASFSFGLVIAIGRLYQTYCHNLVMNEQRLIAFRAYKKMLASVSDEASREKLVAAAANAIFEHGSSGFLPSGTNEFTPLIGPLLEAAKSPKG